ncbi:MAG: glycogen synthase [Clostridiales bacterium]|nr:glycogen synthase [Clostridiales bacterium]
MSDIKILFVSSEVSPYAKSGGLGDVLGSLPKELSRLGADARVVFPKYKTIDPRFLQSAKMEYRLPVKLGWRSQDAVILSIEDDIPTYLIENDFYFGRDGLYGYWDDDERFAFFTKAALEMINIVEFEPDIIHFNDWQTALGPVFLKDFYAGFKLYRNIKSVFTIHNIQHQGNFEKHKLERIGLNEGYFTDDKLEFYGRFSFMKGGLLYADAITTVSETYGAEIQTPEYGYSMDGLLRSNAHKLRGVLNGIDAKKYDPETNKDIYVNFGVEDVELDTGKKRENKRALQAELGLPQSDEPLIGVISRLAHQKGLDLISVALEELMNMGVQMAVLGTGEENYENLLRNTAWRYPDRMSANIYFSDVLAQKIYAGVDIFLMPSLFEPCGLGQLFAMRYGSVPVVRHTGGLCDTVRPHDEPDATGFVFNDYLASGMMWALNEAISVYRFDKNKWKRIMLNGMKSDFSWKTSASKYLDLYESLKK